MVSEWKNDSRQVEAKRSARAVKIVWGEDGQFSDLGYIYTMASKNPDASTTPSATILYDAPDNKGSDVDTTTPEVKDGQLYVLGGCKVYDAESGLPLTSQSDIPTYPQ